MLRKVVIKEKVDVAEYAVEDIFDGTTLLMRVSGKQRLVYQGFQVGSEIYVENSPYDPLKCRLVTSTDFKMDDSNSLNNMKYKLDEKQMKME